MDAVSQPLEILDFDRHFRRRECHQLSEAIVNKINRDDLVCITWNFIAMIAPFTILTALCIVIIATAIIYRNVRCRERT
ncbi:unnamed protein product [Onchocerca ochengi]|uniref:Uncharacterized protein n=1 Tax=Onchocerca ochengi TaxID=42157 RepID=A0A182EM10_ONCOC|nr:unnamed protein product [Onchocerca ochengi]